MLKKVPLSLGPIMRGVIIFSLVVLARLFSGGGVLKKEVMLLINECRTCNADKNVCPIRSGLADRLKKAGIKERLKYKCTDWQQHLKYKIGDKVEFHFIERGEYGAVLSGETLTGKIVDISKKRPVYFVLIDKENLNKIDNEYSNYSQRVWPYQDPGSEPGYDAFFNETIHWTAPVKEELITCIAE